MGRRTTTRDSQKSYRSRRPESTKDSGLGGFPYPTELFMLFLRKYFPNFAQRITGSVTMHGDQDGFGAQSIEGTKLDYISFEAVVGRNSRFLVLSQDDIEELGGVEYRALTALMWIVATVCTQITGR